VIGDLIESVIFMDIRNWHYGKIILLWVWSIAICFLLLQWLESLSNPIIGFLLIAIIIAIPIIMSVVTWKWLSGKEK